MKVRQANKKNKKSLWMKLLEFAAFHLLGMLEGKFNKDLWDPDF